MLQKLKQYSVYTALLFSLVLPLGFAGVSYAAPSTNTTNTTEDHAPNVGGNCMDITKCDFVKKYVDPFVAFMAALVGVAVVISIVIGGIQYGSSGGDPSKVTAAKNRIRNSIVALITFFFLFAILNFLMPGGI